MKRIAFISDLHGDLHALDDALAAIQRIGCELVVCVGDLVDFGLFPDETIARLVERRIPTIRGNHDRWAVEKRGEGSAWSGGWELSSASRAFLRALPTSWSTVLEGTRVAVHHASPRSDMDGIAPDEMTSARARMYLDLADAEILVVGHTHIPCVIHVSDKRIIANPGALLRASVESTDGPEAPGIFGVLELPSRDFRVHRASDGAEIDIVRRRLWP